MGEQDTKDQKAINQPEPPPNPQERSTADYARFEPPKKLAGKKRRAAVILLVFLLLAAAGGAAYWFVLRDKPSAAPATDNKASQTALSNGLKAAAKITIATKNHDSTTFRLQFDYPADWTVAEAEAGGRLNVKSPATVLKDADNQTVTGQIIFTIRPKQQALPEFDSGNATAARPSEKITYTKPAPGQRASTYISFLRYTDSTGGLDGVYITGDTGYTLGQAIPKADFVPVEPIVSLTFVKCDKNCSDSSLAMGVSPVSWDSQDFSGPLKSLLESLVIR